MAEEYETMAAGPSAAGDAHEELESNKTYAPQMSGDRQSPAGALAEEYRAKAEEVWGAAKDRARTLQEDSKEYVRENPIRAVFATLGIGFVLGWMIFRALSSHDSR
jgi:ElaB/YqjD/DUF883 family membrane-anchored ribosome-binding protein